MSELNLSQHQNSENKGEFRRSAAGMAPDTLSALKSMADDQRREAAPRVEPTKPTVEQAQPERSIKDQSPEQKKSEQIKSPEDSTGDKQENTPKADGAETSTKNAQPEVIVPSSNSTERITAPPSAEEVSVKPEQLDAPEGFNRRSPEAKETEKEKLNAQVQKILGAMPNVLSQVERHLEEHLKPMNARLRLAKEHTTGDIKAADAVDRLGKSVNWFRGYSEQLNRVGKVMNGESRQAYAKIHDEGLLEKIQGGNSPEAKDQLKNQLNEVLNKFEERLRRMSQPNSSKARDIEYDASRLGRGTGARRYFEDFSADIPKMVRAPFERIQQTRAAIARL